MQTAGHLIRWTPSCRRDGSYRSGNTLKCLPPRCSGESNNLASLAGPGFRTSRRCLLPSKELHNAAVRSPGRSQTLPTPPTRPLPKPRDIPIHSPPTRPLARYLPQSATDPAQPPRLALHTHPTATAPTHLTHRPPTSPQNPPNSHENIPPPPPPLLQCLLSRFRRHKPNPRL